ncbi:glycosyltransferase family 2 protein [Cryobacterium sp. CG_9.6]|uniref:glycosyltransferase family 2 protein n=1 Tax=Cryobacterium sp. CG_9.6 TaxID=2760710 RepID=UPI0024759F81|nr:glycosyltransferase family 2 protein [Cryobacterium sp. CG_9.6]MDH6235570.1 cellulose synthase/poly-beta-1,6-N-acetylglucosamine synthase-like glycosyltransferase [Cryobacterium sp. CG_9.6]
MTDISVPLAEPHNAALEASAPEALRPPPRLLPDARRRQWGAEKRPDPLSIVHPTPSAGKITRGRLGIVITIVSWVTYVISTIIAELLNNPNSGFRFQFEAISYLLVVTVLTFSALMYLLARQGALYRFRDHERVPRGELDRHFENYTEGITVLVPSYAEEPRVVRGTLWSAALQEFPDLTVVLLIDDPPFPTDPAIIERLTATRALANEIRDALSVPAERFRLALAGFYERTPTSATAELPLLIAEYEAAATWLEEMAEAELIEDHVDDFFVDSVLLGLASELRLTLLGLQSALVQKGSPDDNNMFRLYSRLTSIFEVTLNTFERKQFANLSHEANKAMNLNSYISLMGGRWVRDEETGSVVLRPSVDSAPTDLVVPDTVYVLTLDADSLLLRDYCLRLVYFLESAGNERVAVTQTPYSSFRGAPTRIERVAGATTDIQHILHQGMTYYGATFWVGANAVIRKRALEDIVEVESVGGFEIRTYIQDRTVIEDTESSVDLGTHGWTLANYPERLSYSATPPDFGSLVVQRRRWANGGLLILPKLWNQVTHRRFNREPILFRELLLRVNYMGSIAWSTFGLIFLLAYPYDSRLLSPLVFFAALPYFLAMGSDLKECGHRFSDIFRIYGFNLILLPVNLAGVLKSLQQAITGEKIPFVRTPKVKNRTAAPGLYVVVPYLIVAFSLLTVWRNVDAGNWGNVAFAVLNTVLASVAITYYIGLRNSVVDVFLGMLSWLYVEPRKPKKEVPVHLSKEPKDVDWASVLYYGDRRLNRSVRGGSDRRRRATAR